MDRRGRLMVNMVINPARNKDILNENDYECDNHNTDITETKIQTLADECYANFDDLHGSKVNRALSPARNDSFEPRQQNYIEEYGGLKMINNNYGSSLNSCRQSFSSNPDLITLEDLDILSSLEVPSVCPDIPESEAGNFVLDRSHSHSDRDFSPTDGSEYIPSDQHSDSTNLSDGERNAMDHYLYSNIPIISEPPQNSAIAMSVERDESRESPSVLEELTYDPEFLMADDEESSYSGRPSRGRKRKCPQNRSERKKARNSNKDYFDHKMRIKEPKDFIDYDCQCKKKCMSVVPVQIRKKFFTKFWSLGSYDSQTTFIGVFVREELSDKPTKKKKCIRKYRVESFNVCREMFCKTLNICSTRIATAMGKVNSRMPLLDQRGKMRAGENRVPDVRKQEITDFINTIPLYTSHYSRANTDAKFFKPGVTLISVFNEYKSKYNLNAVSYSFFKQYFYDNFNIKVKVLSKDSCNVCDKSRIEINNAESRGEDVNAFKESHTKHLKQAEKARSQMKTDMELAKHNDEIECLTFDMQKTLPLPRIQTNIIFYKRQIWLYNLGIHSAKRNQSYCYTWVEGQAGRGAQEVGSCLMKHIDENVPDNIQHLILWSDSCGGQNRNIKINLLMKVALDKKPNLKSITFRYLIPGHSYLPNDKDFGDIERALKYNQRLYTPADYLNVMQACKKKQPLTTCQMASDDFYSTELLEKHIVNRKKTNTNKKVNWLNTREIKIEKEELYHIYMKSEFDEENYECLDISRKISIRRQGFENFQTADIFKKPLPRLWPNGKPIAEPKLRDIISIRHLIPEDAKIFYDTLTSSVEANDDIDGLNTELDFDLDNE